MTEGRVEPPSGGFLAELRERAAEHRRRLVYAEGSEPRVLDAAAEIVRDGLADVVLLGEPDAVSAGLSSRGVDPARVEIGDPDDPGRLDRTRAHLAERRADRADPPELLEEMARDPLMQGAAMIARGEVDGGVAGCVRTTADVVRSGLVCIGLARGIETLSSAFYMVFTPDHPVGPAVLTFTDAGVVPVPTSEQLAQIAASAADMREGVVGDGPRVAFLSYSTKGSAEGDDVTRVREALARFRELRPEVPADGELQGDAALSAVVAARKAPDSPVAGRANVLVFPDLGAANLAYKLVQHLGGAVALGPILQGLARPLNDLSRGAEAGDIVAVSCITALMAG